MTRFGLICGFLLLTAPAFGQTAPQPTTSSPSLQFLSRAAFRLQAEYLAHKDLRYVWDADFGGDLDLVDYGKGRVTFFANYQVVLGEELRRFDPNQGNYILGGSGSVRVGGTEAAAVFYHQSRHLSDRPKVLPVDWNMFGGRLQHQRTIGGAHLEGRADLRGVVQKSFVDYRWELDTGGRLDVPVNAHVGVLALGNLRVLGVDGSRNRGNQTGFRVEGGVRLQGGFAAELFVAAERRIDPYPIAFGAEYLAAAGFRLLSR